MPPVISLVCFFLHFIISLPLSLPLTLLSSSCVTRFDRLSGRKVGRKDKQNIHALVPRLFVGAAGAAEADVPEHAEGGA